ncbi:MAG: TatD family hydrolase [Desulfofustis sp.]|nr:TatD family hydrolase [Desulfofustis sp.]NNF48037.1 TatD family hydrolase [Desulfofustis sp.]
MSRKKPPLPSLPDDFCLIDSHCHLDMADYQSDLDQVIDRAARHNVKGIVTIGIDLSSSQDAVAIAKRWKAVRATVGFHPHDADKASQKALAQLVDLVEKNTEAVVGWGEIGLDYVKKYSPPETQRSVFRKQLRIARELKLPVIIHDRDAHEDCLRIVREEGPFEQGGIMHCFSGDLNFARRVMANNFHISIPGIVTYNKADEMQDVASHVPIERLLVETDGPFLAPVPYRGKRNEPLYTLFTAARIAELRGIELGELARQTTENCQWIFGTEFDC